jgi:protein-tyrosine phosphatase
MGVPESNRELLILTRRLAGDIRSGVHTAVHCRAGIGRTGLVAGAVLVLLDIHVDRVFQVLSEARGMAMPDTQEQVEWVKRFARYVASAP